MGCVNSKKAVARAASASPVGPYVVQSSSRKRTSNVPSSAAVSVVVAEPPPPAPSAPPPVSVSASASRSSREHLRSGSVVVTRKSDAKPEVEEWKKGSLTRRLGLSSSSGRFVEAEQNAAGWPSWLTSIAGEAIHGWVPLKTESYEKLDKIGQGTYSSVFRAREVDTGRMVALKKVRFDNLQPESIRFMAREIIILRTLDHPNIMKLEGIITSQLSHSIYLVFEYMEHDLAGLVSSPDIKFSESQIKCYMRQLLSGLEHCHLRGIMHRDIKVSNILVNDEGILKIADFGLANTVNPNSKIPLTSRVVTLWYRPPELLMGSTNYGVSVDLWSVGCVFAELYLGKPILKGRTEVEQLHRIFKLCGSPPEEFWKKCKLPLATMFKPQTNYESSFRERCKGFPATAVKLLETLLTIDPYERGTASSALMSEYFSTLPYACNPSVLPKYPPSKEMDAKNQEDTRRKKYGGKVREAVTSKRQRRVQKVLQDPNNVNKPVLKENTSQNACRDDDGKAHLTKGKVGGVHKGQQKSSYNAKSEAQRVNGSNGYSVYSGPAPVTGSSGFTWVKRRKPEVSSVLSDSSRSKISALDPTFAKGTYDLTKHGIDISERKHSYSTSHQDETSKGVLQKNQARHGLRESFDIADTYRSNHYMEYDLTEKTDAQINTQGHRRLGEPVEQSRPAMIQRNKSDDFLQLNANSKWRSVRRSRLGRDK
ncbi:cyclin-dependent kinase C-2 C-like isoform X2 [Lotus japonicus]|uniref:cyclin-dependent kinase C-2 C-like isoform X2 n=1 Tax=Lotus japonicus TaxID=34305 RepID=UPI002582CF86|nr:cyclin-dependent kinase C-2 C-like isoform X2 [Lotus japonicus]